MRLKSNFKLPVFAAISFLLICVSGSSPTIQNIELINNYASGAVAQNEGRGPLAGDGIEPLTTELVASSLNRPVFVTAPPNDFSRLFIVLKAGRIKILDLDTKTVLATPFLDINALVGGDGSNSDERGFLGLAFHPDYQSNGFFYINYTNNFSDTTVARYTVSMNPDIANPNSAHFVLKINQPQTNHNGGWMDFGPNDGYLYIATGDGGGSGDDDPGHTSGTGNGQDITNNLLGKILRIDVDGDDFPADPNRNYAIPPDNPFVGITGDDEIWAYGLRNPWRLSFDRETGDLYIADPGQSAWEEINFQAASSPGGENYGWRCYEGNHAFNLANCMQAKTMVFPIHEYSYGGSPFRCAVIGGYVYRGCAIPSLHGTYFYADFCSDQIWSFAYIDGIVTDLTDRTAELSPVGGLFINNIASFGEDAAGEIYIMEHDISGRIYKIVPDIFSFPDCNENGITDGCDIADGTSDDENDNGIPDECEVQPCPWDLDNSGSVGTGDLLALFAQWGTDGPADFDESGAVGTSDLLILFANWGPCP